MRSAEHRNGGSFLSELSDGRHDILHKWEDGSRESVAQHDGVREVVDVLRRAGEVHELAAGGKLGQVGEFLLEHVLHRLDVVVRRSLDILDELAVVDAPLVDDVVEEFRRLLAKWRHLRHFVPAREEREPARLHLDARAYEPVLREAHPERRRESRVPSVDGRDGGKRRERHGFAGSVGENSDAPALVLRVRTTTVDTPVAA